MDGNNGQEKHNEAVGKLKVWLYAPVAVIIAIILWMLSDLFFAYGYHGLHMFTLLLAILSLVAAVVIVRYG